MRRADAGLLLSCVFLLTTCSENAPPFQPHVNFVPPLASISPDPTNATITLTVTDTAYGTASGTTNQATSTYIRVMRVEGTASIAVSKRIPEAANPVPNPLKAQNGLGVRVGGGSTPYQVPFQAAGDTSKTYVTLNSGEVIWQAYAGGGTQPNQGGTRADGTPWQCGPSVSNYCYAYSGGGSVTITPLQGDMHLSVDSSTVSIGSGVKFTLTADTVEGRALPIQVDTAQWIPAPTDSGGEPSEAAGNFACAFSGAPLQCTRQILGSGSLRIVAHVSGFRKVVSQPVAVREGHIVLTASRSFVRRQGDSVSFTASWSDGAPMVIDTWSFLPDSGTNTTFGCPAAQNPCKRPIQQSGYMQVKATRASKFRTAKTHVTVVPCPTNDSILDTPNVRKGLDSLWKLSNAEDPVTANRKERSMKIYDSSGTIVVRIAPFDSATDGPCKNTLKTPNPVPGILIAQVHTHPAHINDEMDCEPGRRIRYSGQFGGPSWLDWGGATTSTVQYVIDADNTYRFTGYPIVGNAYWTPILDPHTGLPRLDASGDTLKAPTSNAWKNYYQKKSRKSDSCVRY
jgi:hypothetical protein